MLHIFPSSTRSEAEAMSFFATLSSYWALTPDQKHFLRERQIDDAQPLDTWHAFFAPLAKYDLHGDKAQKIAGIAAGVAAVSAFGAFMMGFFLPIGLSLIVLFIISLAIYFTLKKNNVPDVLREFLLPVLAVLQQDLPPGEPVHLCLDLGGLTDAKQTEPPPHATDYPSQSGYPRIRETYFADPWLTGGTQLVDGSRLTWDITDRVRKRKVTKRNPRGKIKTKHKYKTKRRIDVRLQAPAYHYALNPIETHGIDVEVSTRPGTKRNAVKARRTITTKGEGFYGIPSMDPQPFLDTVAYAYRGVTPT